MGVPDLPGALTLLLPLCVSAGIDLYLTLSLLGLALWHGPLAAELALPDPAGGEMVLAGLLGLYLCEALAQARPLPALIWHNLQLLIRPLAGALLGLLLFRGANPSVLLAAATLGGVTAAFVHVLSWGRGLLIRLRAGTHLSTRFDLMEDLVVIALVALTLLSRDVAFWVALLFLILALFLGHHLHAATRFGFVLLRDWMWGILSPPKWANRDELPPWVLSATAEEGFEGIRGVRAGRRDLSRSRHFEEGWLVELGDRFFFAFRRHRRPVVVPLAGARWGPVTVSPIARTYLLQRQGETSTALFLQRRGPALKSHK